MPEAVRFLGADHARIITMDDEKDIVVDGCKVHILSACSSLFHELRVLAEVTQHIPNKGEHQIRYYGHYSNKSWGLREKVLKTALVPKPLAPTSTGSVQRLTQQQLRFRLTPVVSLSNHAGGR